MKRETILEKANVMKTKTLKLLLVMIGWMSLLAGCESAKYDQNNQQTGGIPPTAPPTPAPDRGFGQDGRAPQ
jgi:hypothetical protein